MEPCFSWGFFVIYGFRSRSSKFSFLKNSINLNQTSRLDVEIYPEHLDVVCILSSNEESEKEQVTTALDI